MINMSYFSLAVHYVYQIRVLREHRRVFSFNCDVVFSCLEWTMKAKRRKIVLNRKWSARAVNKFVLFDLQLLDASPQTRPINNVAKCNEKHRWILDFQIIFHSLNHCSKRIAKCLYYEKLLDFAQGRRRFLFSNRHKQSIHFTTFQLHIVRSE